MFVLLIYAAADALIKETSNLVGLGGVPYLQIQADNFSGTINGLAEMHLPALAADYVKGIGDIPTALVSVVQPVLQDQIVRFVSNLPIYFTQLLLAIIFTYYFLVDGRRIRDEVVGLLPEKEVTTHFLQDIAPVFVIGFIGVIIGPAVYGFILAAYRTMVYFREIKNFCTRRSSSVRAYMIPK